MNLPNLLYEQALWKERKIVCGVDEVGRGAFAGPLVAAGVILKPNLSKRDIIRLLSIGINDSKLINQADRKKIIKIAQKYILYSTIQYIPVSYINRFGIGKANKLAFLKVAESAKREIKSNDLFFLTDYFRIPKLKNLRQNNIIHGDKISISISLASIIAKVERDCYMEKLSLEIPLYGFKENKGYGTKYHRDAIKNYGITHLHRQDFCKNYTLSNG